MKKTLIFVLAALLVGTIAFAADTAEVEITVTVEPYAELTVLDGSGSMTLEDAADEFMDGAFNINDGDFAVVQLQTNYPVALELAAAETMTTMAPGIDPALVFAKAIAANGDTLGVWPQIGYLDAMGNIVGGGGGIYFWNGSGDPIYLAAPDRDDPQDGFSRGTHQFAIGVSTQMNRTPDGAWAAPNDYVATLIATIVAVK